MLVKSTIDMVYTRVDLSSKLAKLIESNKQLITLLLFMRAVD